jgi:Nucleotidyl transferase AbiEii toxin, Type IV TA system
MARRFSGANNHVSVLVASIEDFLVMKAYALAGRDKPKDAYDICYCLDNVPGGIDAMAHAWRAWREDDVVVGAIERLREKFASVESYGPMQVAAFYGDSSTEERQMRARRAFELVSRFLALVTS